MVPSAVLDACVLYPVGLRDTLLNVAERGLFRVLWTEEILAETAHNIVESTPGLTAEHLAKTFAAMRRAFPEAMVHGEVGSAPGALICPAARLRGRGT